MKLKKFINKVFEAKKATEEEYDKAIWPAFKEKSGISDDKLDDLKSMCKGVEKDFMESGKTYTEKSDSGNLIIRWTETEDYIYLYGLVAKTGHFIKEDVPDFRKWMKKLYTKLKEGKKMMTSPHKYSEMLFHQIKKEAEKHGREIQIEKCGNFKYGSSPWLQFNNYEVSLK